ncbi:MAG TPA: hypothetical protein VK698_39530 [Kofleriaceae bacterium]|nr:hypothetical protein [Kofleriaceae bacterium]
MTTATNEPPAHGTYARGNGAPGYRPPCDCPPCRKARLRTKKHNKAMRDLGKGARVPADQARTRLQALCQTMTWDQIAAATGCEPGNLRLISSGRRAAINRSTQNKILAVAPQPPSARGKYVDATGSRRRLQALRALGYSARHIADIGGFATSESRVHTICATRQPTVRHHLAAKITAAYTVLAGTLPPPSAGTTIARNYAAKQGWAPPGAWDNIDDPAAVPDSTGHCGTDRGWWTHRNTHLPVCQRCEAAHQEWKRDHQHLARTEFMKALTAARSAASHRGADIADDGRELIRHGCDYDTAAARIGVTRQHLQQELQRHPEGAAA